MVAQRKKLLIVGAHGALAALALLAEKEGWQVVATPDWTRAARKVKRAKVTACVSGFPNAEEGATIRTLLGRARWIVFDTPKTPDAVSRVRSLGADAVFFIGHVTPGTILKQLT